MKTIYDKQTRDLLLNRINFLDETCQRQWGKMNIFQMLKHNTSWNSWILGKEKQTYQQRFLGRLFGKVALKRMIKNENPFDKNVPTSRQFKVEALNGDFEAEKSEWIGLLKQYENYSNPEFIHDFFGKMTEEEIGIMVYKHTDHHLRQFGV